MLSEAYPQHNIWTQQHLPTQKWVELFPENVKGKVYENLV